MADEINVQHAKDVYERAKSAGTDSAEAEAELRRARAQLLAVGQDI
jgi:F-type H+-transporting ATPase subunit epsilon